MKEIKKLVFTLKLFDDAINTTGSAGLSAEMKTYYSDYLIDMARANLVHDQFGQEKPLPKNGGKVVEFRKYMPLPKATTPLTEGVTPDGQEMKVTTVTAEIHQYGGYIMLSDILKLTAIDDNLVEATELVGDQAGRTLDTISREVLNGGSNVMYAPNGTTEITARSSITKESKLTVDVIVEAAINLRGMNAKTIDGKYICIVHPYATYDLLTDPRWIDMQKHQNSEKLYNGELGCINNVRFVETSEAKIHEKAGADQSSVFSTLVLAANAYGVIPLEGGGLEHIVKQLGSAGTADPINQRATTGWKAATATTRLVEEYMIRIESSASKYSMAAAN